MPDHTPAEKRKLQIRGSTNPQKVGRKKLKSKHNSAHPRGR